MARLVPLSLRGKSAQGLSRIFAREIWRLQGLPPWGPIYTLNETELEELRNWLKNMTEMGATRPSKAPCRAPVPFVPKAHGRGLPLCIDYCGLNY